MMELLRYVLFGPQPCVRDLGRRSRIIVDGKPATVADIQWCDGKDGREGAFIEYKGKTAVALRISFFDRDSIIAHPGHPVKRTD